MDDEAVRALTSEQAILLLAEIDHGLTSYQLRQVEAKANMLGQKLCPGCNEAPATNRQKEPNDHRCGWCGYNYLDGSFPVLVPA